MAGMSDPIELKIQHRFEKGKIPSIGDTVQYAGLKGVVVSYFATRQSLTEMDSPYSLGVEVQFDTPMPWWRDDVKYIFKDRDGKYTVGLFGHELTA